MVVTNLNLVFLLVLGVSAGVSSNVKRVDLGDRTLNGNPFLKFHLEPVRKILAVGEALILTCEIVSSPSAFIYWTYENIIIQGSPLSNRTDIEHNHGKMVSEAEMVASTLTIFCPRPGRYSCYASNTMTTIHSTVQVDIEGYQQESDCFPSKKPLITQNTEIRFEINGNSASLICESNSPNLKWFQGNEQLVTNEKYTILPNELVIRNLSWADMHEFTCNISNNYGSDSRSLVLNPVSLGKNILF